MNTIQILVGTTSGNTEFLADYTADLLQQQGILSQLHYQPDVTQISRQQPWLALLASHGAGDYAESMAKFYHQLGQLDHLPQLPYSVIAIGESCYDTYCAAGHHLDKRLSDLGAFRLSAPLEIDMLDDDPETSVSQWLPNWIHLLGSYPHDRS